MFADMLAMLRHGPRCFSQIYLRCLVLCPDAEICKRWIQVWPYWASEIEWFNSLCLWISFWSQCRVWNLSCTVGVGTEVHTLYLLVASRPLWKNSHTYVFLVWQTYISISFDNIWPTLSWYLPCLWKSSNICHVVWHVANMLAKYLTKLVDFWLYFNHYL